jgi:hypothetical protein
MAALCPTQLQQFRVRQQAAIRGASRRRSLLMSSPVQRSRTGGWRALTARQEVPSPFCIGFCSAAYPQPWPGMPRQLYPLPNNALRKHRFVSLNTGRASNSARHSPGQHVSVHRITEPDHSPLRQFPFTSPVAPITSTAVHARQSCAGCCRNASGLSDRASTVCSAANWQQSEVLGAQTTPQAV